MAGLKTDALCLNIRLEVLRKTGKVLGKVPFTFEMHGQNSGIQAKGFVAVTRGDLVMSLQEASDARCSQQLAVAGISHFYAVGART
jgi:hypothetical protein